MVSGTTTGAGNDWRKHKTEHPVAGPLQTELAFLAFLSFQSELASIAKQGNHSVGELATIDAQENKFHRLLLVREKRSNISNS